MPLELQAVPLQKERRTSTGDDNTKGGCDGSKMKEVKGNIWDYHDKGYWIVITTNGTVRKDGACVMGRGVAKQAAIKYPQLPRELGKLIKLRGNVCHVMWGLGIITFPVKHNWWEKADLTLIEKSCKELVQKVCDIDEFKSDTYPENNWPDEVYMVRPGCGNGGLRWKDVEPILDKHLKRRYIVVEVKQ